jgi:biotin operon repressor
MTEPVKVKESAKKVAAYLEQRYPNFVSVYELITGCQQSDVRKRISELIAAGYDIEKERYGRYVNVRYTS